MLYPPVLQWNVDRNCKQSYLNLIKYYIASKKNKSLMFTKDGADLANEIQQSMNQGRLVSERLSYKQIAQLLSDDENK